MKNESRFHQVTSLWKKANCHMLRKDICFLNTYSWKFFSHWISSIHLRPQDLTFVGVQHLFGTREMFQLLLLSWQYTSCSWFTGLRESCTFFILITLYNCLRPLWSQATDINTKCGIRSSSLSAQGVWSSCFYALPGSIQLRIRWVTYRLLQYWLIMGCCGRRLPFLCFSVFSVCFYTE